LPDGVGGNMIRSELAERLAVQYQLGIKDADRALGVVLTMISKALGEGRRVELRGFGSFSVKHRPERIGRNPRSGEPVTVPEKRQPYFRCGKEMRERLNGRGASRP
jgi:integration host factor subunit beta